MIRVSSRARTHIRFPREPICLPIARHGLRTPFDTYERTFCYRTVRPIGSSIPGRRTRRQLNSLFTQDARIRSNLSRLVHLRGKLPSPTQISYFSNKRIVSRCKSFACAILTRYSRLDESRIFPPDISSGEKRIEKFSESLDHRRLQSTFFHLFRLKRNGTEENIRFESWLRSRHKYVAELAEILIYL